MTNFKILEIFTLVILIKNSFNCQKGCLKCINKKCLICDQKSFFIKENNKCIFQKIDNCKKISKDGFCLICEKNYYFSKKTKLCEKVEKKIKNCLFYKNPTKCEICKKQFYENEGKCEKVRIDVLNCLVYEKDFCHICETGYFLHFSKERCIKKEEKHKNCMIFGFVDCEKCDDGYLKEKNFFLENLKKKFFFYEKQKILDKNKKVSPKSIIKNNEEINIENNFSFDHEELIQKENLINFEKDGIFFNSDNYLLFNNKNIIQNLSCIKTETENCTKNNDYKTCIKCIKNYYLTKNNKCKSNPLSKIENCEIYINEYMCQKCEVDYKLIQSNICSKIEKIPNCKYHSQIDSYNKCIECQSNFFLDNNKCEIRDNSIINCKEFNKKKDDCEKCETNFFLSLNNLLCLKDIENCKEYNVIEENNYYCKKCRNKFYLENNSCLSGNIENCENYLNDKKCEKCENGFYLKNELCEKNEFILNCQIFSSEKKKICTQCENSSLLVNYKKKCILIDNLITNCFKYGSKDTCEECEDHYFLFNNNCILIANDENCIRKKDNICTLCKDKYLLKNGTCEKIDFFHTQNCLEFENPGLNHISKCLKCKENYFPVNSSKKFFCHQKSYLKKIHNFVEIQNCLKYEEYENDIICRQCNKNLFISEDGSQCVENCLNQKLLYFADDTFTENYYIKSNKGIFNKCIDISLYVQNCEIASLTTNNSKYICIKCKAGNLPVIGNDANNLLNPFDSNQGYFREYKNSFQNHFLNKTSYFSEKYNVIFGINYLGFYCEEPPGGLYSYESTKSTDPEPNCELFSFIILLNSTKISCQRCKFGYTGKISSFTYNGVTYRNMFCNEEIEYCNKNVRYGGISSILTKAIDLNFAFINCHKCQNNKIPVFAYNENYDYLDIFQNKWFICLDITEKSFGVEKNFFLRNKIENCGFYKFFTNRPKIFKKAVYHNMLECLYCEPGFKPFFDENNEKVVKCEKIENCVENSVWFNSCSKCKEFYTWNFITEINGNFIVYDNCKKFQDLNCLISSKNNNSCILCKKEYSINEDGICEIFNFPNCQDKFSKKITLFYNYDALNKDFFVTFPFLIENNTGCSLCKEDYLSYYTHKNSYSCVFSEYLKKIEFNKIYEKSFFIINCKFYTNSNIFLKCVECKQNFILTEDLSKCLNKENFPNCLIIKKNKKKCHICEEKFANVNGFCEFGKIDFCLQYILNANFQKCEKCINGYYIKNNNCILGKIKNCKEYDNHGLCLVCLNNYTLYNNNYCLYTKIDFSCEKGIIDNLANFQCEKCLINHAFIENEEISSKCISLTKIENCKKYDKSIENSTFLCEECEIGYYLQNDKCYKRTIGTEFCILYNIHHDFCEKCLKNFFLTNSKKCKKNPKGIKNCILYDNEENCKKCDKDFYINNKKCEYIDKKIENCDFYKNINICEKCKNGFFLTDNLNCKKSKIENCLKQKKNDKCQKCQKNYGLFYKNGIQSCIFLTKKNCIKINQYFPYNCISCEKFYYEENGECFLHNIFIKNCEIYETEETCQKCENNYILDFNKKICFSKISIDNQKKLEKLKNSEIFKDLDLIENCINNQEKKNICLVCDFGYIFYNEKCTKCLNATLEDGCLFCESYESEKCILCKSAILWILMGFV